MLTEQEVKALIVARLQKVDCYSHYLEEQIRALVAVLTGNPPPNAGGDVATYLNLADIPYKRIGSQIDFDTDWLEANGFEIDGERINHPRLSRNW